MASLSALSKSRKVMRWLSLERWKHLAWTAVRTVLIVGISFIILYPILQKVSNAFKHKSDIYNPMVVWVPQHFTLDNVKAAMKVMNYWDSLLGTLVLAGSTMILQMFICALAGYSFARLKFPGSSLLFGLVIFTIIVPPQTIMIPLYMNFKDWGMIDTYWPFIISALTGMGLKSGLYIFIFRQFFRGIPKEVEEAALVDGAGLFQTFYRIMLPNALPAIVTVMLFSFVWQWNDSFFTTLYLPDANVLPTALGSLPYTAEAHAVAVEGSAKLDRFYLAMLENAGILLAITPLIILYSFVQKYFVEGVERTGVVG